MTVSGSDGAFSDGATVIISILPVNDTIPLAISDIYTGAEDMTLVISVASGVLVNDSDGDGDSLQAVLVNTTTSGTL